MWRLGDSGIRLCDGLTRREWLRIGGTALGGLTLERLAAGRDPQTAVDQLPAAIRGSFGRAKSVIVLGLTGGPPQHETWDPKPDAPQEIRGPFGTIATATPGYHVGELMPRTARWTDRLAVLRAVVTNDNAHSSSGYQMLTGVPHQPLNQESATPRPPNISPSMGALVRALRPQPGQLPSAVTLPEHIWNDGNFPWPGQDAGFLGPRHHPWLIHCQPHEEDFSGAGLSLPDELPTERFLRRRALLDQLNDADPRASLAGLRESAGEPAPYGLVSRTAFDLLAGSRAQGAFDLRQEPDTLRDRYGRSRFAQSVLLARRLIEAGVSLVQVNWTRIKDQPNQGGWDTHDKHAESCQKLLMPMMDQVFTALLEDLESRGLLDETLVVWFGEFGRTPKFNARGGRDHWGRCFSLALAGGGIRGGVVHGSSDRDAALPVDGVVTPADFQATIFHCLGYRPETEVHDLQGRPWPISRGQVVAPLVA